MCRPVIPEDRDEHLTDHALAGPLEAAEDDGDFGLPAGMLDTVSKPADEPAVVRIVAIGMDLPRADLALIVGHAPAFFGSTASPLQRL